MIPRFDRHRVGGGHRAVVLAVSTALGTVGALSTVPAAMRQAPSVEQGTQARLQVLEVHRATVANLRDAATDAAPADQIRRALADARKGLDALADTTNAPIPDALRKELRASASGLAAVADAPRQTVPSSVQPVLLLLERVRPYIAGDVGPGLTFEGSYSQSRPKEPAYGGHASAMGPAPAPVSGADDGLPVPVVFEEGARVEARSFCGGPTKDHILESACGGVALFDYDDDGLLDIYLVTAAELTPARARIPHRNVLYRNLGGWKFQDVSKQAGVDLAAWGSGVCVGDVDSDGRLDLYVTNWGSNVLFRNRGDGTFEDITQKAGPAAGGWSSGCTFFDADADGDLDLYVARYVETTWDSLARAQRSLVWRNGPNIMVGPAGLPGEADLFFENVGNAKFVEATDAHGLTDRGRAYSFGVVATDYDGDGLVDLFVANDSNPNFLYHNLGNGRFEEVGQSAGVAVNGDGRAQAGMGVDAGDYDGDGRVDFVLTAFAHDQYTLYHGIDDRHFEDASTTAGIAAPTFARMGWGAAFLDADLDGKLDLFFANGHIFPDVDQFPQLGETFRQKNQLFLNQGTRFRDVSERAGGGLQIARVGRGLAVADLDNDGDLDLVVNNMDDAPTLLENRQKTGHHWIGIQPMAPTGNRFAIGAKVTVSAGGRTQMREIRSGGSFLSQNDLRAFFGLGDSATAVDVEVRMPGGHRWSWKQLPVDRLHVLTLSSSGGSPAP